MRYIIYFIIGFCFWLLLTLSVNLDHLIAGVIVVLLGTIIFGGYFTDKPVKFLQLHRLFWFIIYIPFFIWYMFKANIDVAYRVLHPQRPIKPGIVKIRTTLKTNIAKVFLANSITLTPGTMTCEIDDDYLYIHWIWVQSSEIEEASKIIARDFEKFLRRIFE
ncbi:MAG: Na+/H+ antiporter subunit E [Candidatus Stahlbacteria bacterium]|nr:Na+/H+ antiporter subunit E [candidate division WOR-3 bacterium]TET59245.1 MAG: Na+/H+ antiporter subunit E [Candidatus Stahlbacteria bacterium]